MDTNVLPPAGNGHSSLAPAEPRTRWIGWSLIAGLTVGLPAAVLLSYLAMLPFLLGLFFFLLLGLIVGATMFRLASKSPLPGDAGLLALGTTVTILMIAVSIYMEYQALPRSVEKVVRESFYRSFTAAERADLGNKSAQFVDSELKANYPPGGLLGYMRWAVRSGRLDCPRFFVPGSQEYRLPQRRALWTVRVVLSTLLLEWTIMSQLLSLKPKPVQPGGTPSRESEDT